MKWFVASGGGRLKEEMLLRCSRAAEIVEERDGLASLKREVKAVGMICRKRPVQHFYFWNAYEKVFDEVSKIERLPAVKATRHSKKLRAEMIERALDPEASDGAFLSAAKETAIGASLISGEEDWLRQMREICEARDELRELIQSAKLAAEKDVADDEDLLRQLVEEADQHDDPDAFLTRRQEEREELRRNLDAEDFLLKRILSTTPTYAGDETPAGSPSHLPKISAPAAKQSDSKDRLDAETARLVAETARLELEEDGLAARKKLFGEALAARRRASERKHHATSSESEDVASLVALLTKLPCDNTKSARAASKIAEYAQKGGARGDAFRLCGGVGALVAQLNTNCTQLELYQFVRALCVLASHDEDGLNRACMIDCGVLPLLVRRVSLVCETSPETRRLLGQLWRSLDADSSSHYAEGIAMCSRKIVEPLLSLVGPGEPSAVEIQLLAARAVLFLLYTEETRSRNWRLVILGQGGVKALVALLERDFDKSEEVTSAAAKAVCADALFFLLSPGLERDVTIDGTSRTISSLGAFAAEKPPGSASRRAAVSLIRYLFERLSVVAANAESPILTAAAVKAVVHHVEEQPEELPNSWFVREVAVETLRKMLEKSSTRLVGEEGAVGPLVHILVDNEDNSQTVLKTKIEAAKMLSLFAADDKSRVDEMVSTGAVPALVDFVDSFDKDEVKESGVTALWAVCKDSRHNRDIVVKCPRGVKILMNVVARTSTCVADEAACNLLHRIISDDAGTERCVRMQQDIFGDVMTTLDLLEGFGETPELKAAAKILKDKLAIRPPTYTRSRSSVSSSSSSSSLTTPAAKYPRDAKQTTNLKKNPFAFFKKRSQRSVPMLMTSSSSTSR